MQDAPTVVATKSGTPLDGDSQSASHALTSLFRRYNKSLIQFLAYRLNGDRERAADVAQEAYLRLVRHSNNAVPHECGNTNQKSVMEQPRAFLFRVAQNVVTDQYRREKVRQFDAGISTDQIQTASSLPSQEQALSDKQQLSIVQATILELPPRCREVFFLSRFEGLSNVAIAQRLKISLSMVEKHIARAMQDIRRAVSRDSKAPEHAD